MGVMCRMFSSRILMGRMALMRLDGFLLLFVKLSRSTQPPSLPRLHHQAPVAAADSQQEPKRELVSVSVWVVC